MVFVCMWRGLSLSSAQILSHMMPLQAHFTDEKMEAQGAYGVTSELEFRYLTSPSIHVKHPKMSKTLCP